MLMRSYKNVSTEHSTAQIEPKPNKPGKLRLVIDGVDVIEWFQFKYREVQKSIGINQSNGMLPLVRKRVGVDCCFRKNQYNSTLCINVKMSKCFEFDVERETL